MYLYHATFAAYKGKIDQEGLVPGAGIRNFSQSSDDCIYLAFDPDIAVSFVKMSENKNADKSSIIVYAVDSSDLDIEKISYDYNVYAEHLNDICSMQYHGIINRELLSYIPAELLHKGPDPVFSQHYTFADMGSGTSHVCDNDGEVFPIWMNLYRTFTEEIGDIDENGIICYDDSGLPYVMPAATGN